MKKVTRADRPKVGFALAGLVSICWTASPASAAVQANDSHLSTTSDTAPVSADELAKKLANPIASMISVPFQNNFDWGAGPNGDGFKWSMNIQPVIPIKLNDRWNLITRTIIPIVSQDDIGGTPLMPSGSQTGLGDVLVSAWFSPVEPTSNGWILGVGPALSFPTGTNNLLTSDKWLAGPTVIALKQQGSWTYGALVNHLWDYAGDDSRGSVNNTFIQPFLSLNQPGGWTYSLNTESSYDWQASQWTVPVNLAVSKLVKFGNQPVQFQLGGRYYVEKPDNGPEWGLRFGVTFLFPQ
jgi:hypothetical protein